MYPLGNPLIPMQMNPQQRQQMTNNLLINAGARMLGAGGSGLPTGAGLAQSLLGATGDIDTMMQQGLEYQAQQTQQKQRERALELEQQRMEQHERLALAEMKSRETIADKERGERSLAIEKDIADRNKLANEYLTSMTPEIQRRKAEAMMPGFRPLGQSGYGTSPEALLGGASPMERAQYYSLRSGDPSMGRPFYPGAYQSDPFNMFGGESGPLPVTGGAVDSTPQSYKELVDRQELTRSIAEAKNRIKQIKSAPALNPSYGGPRRGYNTVRPTLSADEISAYRNEIQVIMDNKSIPKDADMVKEIEYILKMLDKAEQ